MKISEYMEYLDKKWDGNDNERLSKLSPLVMALSPVSRQTILGAQPRLLAESDGNYSAFVEAQSKEIKTCLELELREIGIAVRENFNLPPLTLDTEIEP
jgi:hypothetical protein